ncbi:MAG: hypothetical protein JJT82_08930 [Legionellaceae bacterium]|nr:hypothetical protein [Legionellaceae bacterium]
MTPSNEAVVLETLSTPLSDERNASDVSHKPPTLFSNQQTSVTDSSKVLATSLHESGYLYLAYGALDGLSNAYSSWKYLFDIHYCNSPIDSADALHEWMLTRQGLLLVGFETLVLVAYSSMGNYFDDDASHLLKKWAARSWPYVRDCIKGSKNAFKGLRTSLQVSSRLLDIPLLQVLLPASLLLGLMATANRLLLRYMYGQRKEMMKLNKELLLAIQAAKNMSDVEERYRSSPPRQQKRYVRRLAYIGAAFGGLVDGMYMYVGILGLVLNAVTLPVLFLLTACSALYLAACIVTRLYEEFNYQLRVDVSVSKIELAYTGKLLTYELDAFLILHQKKIEDQQPNAENPPDTETKTETPPSTEPPPTTEIPPNPEHLIRPKNSLSAEELVRYEALFKTVNAQLIRFSNIQTKLIHDQSMTWTRAFLMGLRHGLSAYGVLTSCLFAAATILTLCSVTLPVTMLVSCIVAGLALLGIFLAHAFYKACHYQRQARQLDEESRSIIEEVVDTIKRHETTVENLKPDEFKNKLFGYMTVDPSPQFFFQEWFEVVRSFFSGIGKGSKSIDYTLNNYQERGEDGHYHHATLMMLSISAVSSLIFAFCLALRALCKGFGRPAVDAISPEKEQELLSSLDRSSSETTATLASETPEKQSSFCAPPDSPAAATLAPETQPQPVAEHDSTPSETAQEKESSPPSIPRSLSAHSIFSPANAAALQHQRRQSEPVPEPDGSADNTCPPP